MFKIKKLLVVGIFALHALCIYAEEQPVAVATTEEGSRAADILKGLNRVLGLNGVANDVRLKLIVDTLEKAKELLIAGDQNLEAAQDLITKAQNLPGSQTVIKPGILDDHGHPVEFSMWRMLALVNNGKDPIARER